MELRTRGIEIIEKNEEKEEIEIVTRKKRK